MKLEKILKKYKETDGGIRYIAPNMRRLALRERGEPRDRFCCMEEEHPIPTVMSEAEAMEFLSYVPAWMPTAKERKRAYRKALHRLYGKPYGEHPQSGVKGAFLDLKDLEFAPCTWKHDKLIPFHWQEELKDAILYAYKWRYENPKEAEECTLEECILAIMDRMRYFVLSGGTSALTPERFGEVAELMHFDDYWYFSRGSAAGYGCW